jgi:hypothetical protein
LALLENGEEHFILQKFQVYDDVFKRVVKFDLFEYFSLVRVYADVLDGGVIFTDGQNLGFVGSQSNRPTV